MNDGEEIRRLTHQVADLVQRIEHLTGHLTLYRDGYERMAGLLAKAVLSAGGRHFHLIGPHALPPYHLTTGHVCKTDGDDCTDDVYYHQGPPEDCQDCLQAAQAIKDRNQPDPQRQGVPGRPFGLAQEERN